MQVPMQLTDTHAHLYLKEFDNDRELVVRNALLNHVSKIILPNIDSSSIGPLKQLHGIFPSVTYPLMGLHPVSVKEDYEDELKTIKLELRNGRYYGIGESGIDLFWDTSFIEQQRKAFAIQIEWAIEFDLPVIIHARESFEEIFRILHNFKHYPLKGIFHAFTGTANQAKKIINDFGFYLGIGGILTFKNAGLDKVISGISLDHVVVETDSPYLAPVPHRGKRNESSNILHIAEKLAQIKNMNLSEVALITTSNAKKIFKI